MTSFDAAIAAIHNRDPAQLEQAFDSAEAAAKFRDEVLHTLEPADCRWFWEQTFDAEQFRKVAGMVVDVAAAIARKQGLVLGTDYSQSVDETGLAQLICSEMTFSRIAAELPQERRSVLKALVRSIPG
jgi:hypothetical protein